MISLMVALTKKKVICSSGKMPWHISDELKLFKKITTGHSVIMGRKTFEAIGKPLKDRHNVIVSTTLKDVDGVDVCTSLDEAIEKAKSYGKEVFIIGGASIYKQALDIVDKMYFSYIKEDHEGTLFFPEFDESLWRVENREDHPEFEFVIYVRK